MLDTNIKVNGLTSVTHHKSSPLFEWCVVMMWIEEHTPKGHAYERNWSACSIFDDHSRLNQHMKCV